MGKAVGLMGLKKKEEKKEGGLKTTRQVLALKVNAFHESIGIIP